MFCKMSFIVVDGEKSCLLMADLTDSIWFCLIGILAALFPDNGISQLFLRRHGRKPLADIIQ